MSAAATIARSVLALAGVALVITGIAIGVATIPVADWTTVLAWLALAVIVHDGILAPLVAALALRAGALTARIGPRLAGIARALLVSAAIASVIAMPGLVVRARGPRNETIHTTDYLAVLAVVWALVVGGAIVCVLLGWRAHSSPRSAPAETES